MLCEALRRLYPFGKLETYRYVGFGSIYFSDFLLFHRALGIDNMLSIEKDVYARECFEFNRPYRCVKLDFRLSSEVLPTLDWDAKSIIWLDYDGKLDDIVLSDVTSVCAKACSGTVIIVSVNAQPESEPDEIEREQYTKDTGLPFNISDYRLRHLKNRIDGGLPYDISGSDLRGKGLARVSRRLINGTITEVLSVRNSVVADKERISYEQLFNFEYKDGASILTVGGLLVAKEHTDKLKACAFEELPFIERGEEAYNIQVPCLTPREMRHLNAQLPHRQLGQIELPGVPSKDVALYAELYRYFPVFTESVFS
jgi:hypothetical protein